jgi:hypothetical protein
MTTVSGRHFCPISTTTVVTLSQKSPISDSTEIRPKEATMIRRTDGQTEMSKLERSLSATMRFSWGNLKERDHLGDRGVDGRIILR